MSMTRKGYFIMKKIFAIALAALLVLALLAGCGSKTAETPAAETKTEAEPEPAAETTAETAAETEAEPAGELKPLVVGASSTPHAEILEQVKDALAADGWDLQIVIYDDYVLPNKALADKELDANYFQHGPYLEDFNKKNNTHLVSVAAIHYEPLGLYPGKTKSLNDLADGAKIAVPNDTTNEARALQLLAAQGIITLKEDAGLAATKNDVVDNPHNIELVEMEAAQLPRTLSDVDFAVINGNYAATAGFSASKDALAVEDETSEAAQTYANLLVVEEGNENEPAIKALVAALTSQTVKDYIDSTYDGAVVAVF